MTRVFADDAHHTLAAHDAAGFAELLDGGTDFHGGVEVDKGGWSSQGDARIEPDHRGQCSITAPCLARRGRIRNTLRAVGKARCVFF